MGVHAAAHVLVAIRQSVARIPRRVVDHRIMRLLLLLPARAVQIRIGSQRYVHVFLLFAAIEPVASVNVADQVADLLLVGVLLTWRVETANGRIDVEDVVVDHAVGAFLLERGDGLQNVVLDLFMIDGERDGLGSPEYPLVLGPGRGRRIL